MGKKVTFTLPAEVVGDATSAVLLGEFNNWSYDSGIALKKQKDGSMKVTTTLEGGRSYQYRYLLNDGRWVNDQKADEYIHVAGLQVENCVVTVPAEEAIPKPARAVKTVKEKKALVSETTLDDLTKIKGIDKKIVTLLAAENISSFKDLSKLTGKKLTELLSSRGGKFQSYDPSTWTKQAKLAAAGKWEELENFKK